MSVRVETLKQEMIEKVTALVQSKMSGEKADKSAYFIRQFYTDVLEDDVLGVDPEDLYGAALSLLHFGGKRDGDAPKVRAYNPQFEKHGWRCRHTVIEIINDDMPFLVDSVAMELNALNLTVHLVIHPIFQIERDEAGRLVKVAEGHESGNGATRESFMQIQVDEQTSPEALREIEASILRILGNVRAAVEDWPAMLEQSKQALESLTKSPPPIDSDKLDEAVAFLEWIRDNHFTFIGYRDVNILHKGKNATVEILEGSGLGVLRDPATEVFAGLRQLGNMPPEVQEFLRLPEPILITKSSLRSTVHRPAPLDAIAVKKFDAKGNVTGERIFVGLFTSTAYSASPRRIPVLGQKVNDVLARSGFDPRSHSGKALMHVLESFPRDELFQIEPDVLEEIAIGIVSLQERQRIALFVRHDPFGRFVSAFVYVPRDRYNPALRRAFQDIIAAAFNGVIASHTAQFGDEPLGRLHFTVATRLGEIPDYDIREIESRLRDAGRTWSDRLHDVLVEQLGEETGNRLCRQYGNAFPVAYQQRFSAATGVFDVEKIEEVRNSGQLAMNLYHPIEAEENELRFKVYNPDGLLTLSDVLPVLENMGLKVMSEIPFEVTLDASAGDGGDLRIHDFALVTSDGSSVDFEEIRDEFHESFAQVWRDQMEDDGFNRLVLGAGLNWREVVILRSYCKYLRQARIPFSQDYMEETLAKNRTLAGLLVKLFEIRFDPGYSGKRQVDEIKTIERIEEALEAVSNLDEDRIIRHYLNLIQSTLRTNFYQPAEDGSPKPYVTFKLDSGNIDELPLPRPLREIFVYSPRFEGVHLRFGFVARGGLRWSDRREDFRTEVLGLAKAQQVKNAVIVPVGSKGGFVLKKAPPPSDREAFMEEGITVYKTFIGAMLDVTDNLSGDDVIPPLEVVRKDADDPYLVVAADKGTATFSDFANGVARDRGFWLDDAFASGGSAGYDHKGMGITARGAWESVKRHFREMGHDSQSEDFTCVGCGDMSGDVFGNGMLLSEHIRLVGAFNHLHIFVDPSPDAATSFKERRRLFDLPRSSWSDYDAKLISKGGGVFDRSAKSIDLTPEIQELYGITSNKVPPNELLKAMLLAEVDLLWFGGIGTYIKSSDEDHADAGDRANDPIRVDGRDLRCKVVGEGANLGVTQFGRIEFAQNDGRINTDFIDNSAGVDTSDHEVNIKIALGDVVQRGDMTMKQRDTLLAKMTDEVSALVLRNNYQQTQALSVTEAQSYRRLDQQQRMMRILERANLLNRQIEFLPDDEEIADRQSARQGLTRPELSVLLAYSKNITYERLLESDLPDESMLEEDLLRYFPEPLRKKHKAVIGRHRLRREIIATVVTNSMINRVGPTFVTEMQDRTGKNESEIARAYTIVREAFELRPLWQAIEDLDNKVSTDVQSQMLMETGRTLERMTLWFLRNGEHPLDIRKNAEVYGAGIQEISGKLESLMAPDQVAETKERAARFVQPGVPKELAQQLGRLKALSTACDIVRIAQQSKRQVGEVGETYFLLGSRFKLDWLRHNANIMTPENPWHQMALGAIIDDLWGTQCDLAGRVLVNGGCGGEAIDDWAGNRRDVVGRVEGIVNELEQHGSIDLAMLTVANRELRGLVTA
jgi:glutamate dehydrogenase